MNEILKIPELPIIEIIDDLVQVYKEYMVVCAALKLDLFSWLAENGPASPEKIAAGTGVKPEYMTSLLGMLYYLDMVRKAGDEFSISPAAQMNFVKTSPFYQGDYIINLPNDDSPWKDIDVYLTKPEEKKAFDNISMGSARAQANYALRGTIQNVTNILKTWEGFSDARTFLEINGGHGLYAIAACQNNPEMTATVLCGTIDTAIAREYISRFKMDNRITAVSGDMMTYSGPQSDIILIAHSLYSQEDNMDELMKNVASSLSPGGLFLSNHWFTAPPVGTGMQGLYELELALHTRYHQLADKKKFEDICEKNALMIQKTGVIRSPYGEATIHMAEKKRA
ncbi:MAG: hypothetical protein GXY48_07835 [Methanomicrobiales archaeon]|nr:hypothetical protein [Methanomicrobiales archaeon]